MRSGLIRLRRGPRWLRRHVEVIAMPGDRTHTVTARTAGPEVSITLLRHPAAGRVTISEAGR